eukprot:NODE_116_length_3288_cov_49.393049_g108_i0.p2 GENE.NODE_116_length_3288_cov_49.393049_g108_i0~~NODE_116_length_3288_cov_49.393049_g108_i0.p2  ORF type:complete len:461 (+),score=80.99 NODE_116_length_3288_cov_49.393049_g108_i0:90-1472(+)
MYYYTSRTDAAAEPPTAVTTDVTTDVTDLPVTGSQQVAPSSTADMDLDLESSQLPGTADNAPLPASERPHPLDSDSDACQIKDQAEDSSSVTSDAKREVSEDEVAADTPEPDHSPGAPPRLSDFSPEAGTRALLSACVQGEASLAEALLELGVCPNSTASNGISPVLIATVHGRTDIVRLLISYGALVDAKALVPAVVLAAKPGHLDEVIPMLNLMNIARSGFVDSGILFASAEGCTAVVAALLALGANPNTCNNSLTPLIVASEKGDSEVVAMLLHAKAGVDKVVGSQLTALSVAARNGHVTVVQQLLDSELDLRTLDNALIFAGKRMDPAIIKLLAAKGMQESDDFGPNALRLAITEGCDMLIGTLIESGVDVNGTTGKGMTALLAACERGLEVPVAQLIAANANVGHCADSGLTPLVVGSINGHARVVEMLLEAGVDVSTSENIPAVVLAGKYGHQK